jgi:hypothetical protein
MSSLKDTITQSLHSDFYRGFETQKPEPVAPATPRKQSFGRPQLFTYALKQWTIERRTNGWHICKSVAASCGEKPEYEGPFQTIENACLAIARYLATETANRHTRSIESHTIDPGDPLYGLKPTTKMPAEKRTSKRK